MQFCIYMPMFWLDITGNVVTKFYSLLALMNTEVKLLNQLKSREFHPRN